MRTGTMLAMLVRVLLAIGATLACSQEPMTASGRAGGAPQRHADTSPPGAQDAVGPPAMPGAVAPPAGSSTTEHSLGSPTDVLAALRSRGFGTAADVIERRIAQRTPKMRLDAASGERTGRAVLAISDRSSFAALQRVMPRSTVELARAVAERGVELAEAEAIATYLVRVVDALDFERLATFDDNHSHVTGREWHQIDYSGEGMSWQGQRDYWVPRPSCATAGQRAIELCNDCTPS